MGRMHHSIWKDYSRVQALVPKCLSSPTCDMKQVTQQMQKKCAYDPAVHMKNSSFLYVSTTPALASCLYEILLHFHDKSIVLAFSATLFTQPRLTCPGKVSPPTSISNWWSRFFHWDSISPGMAKFLSSWQKSLWHYPTKNMETTLIWLKPSSSGAECIS